jgi:uncharacterized damage-inducible protein DinB
MTIKDVLLRHLTYTFEVETWQPPLAEAVKDLTAGQAAWKPGPERHSIWQIVRHITLWTQGVLEAWDGHPPDMKAIEARDWGEATGDDAAWQADVRALHDVTAKIKARVEASDEAFLEGKMPSYQGVRDQTAVLRLLAMATHDVYHAGQIRYIRALQGA